MKRLILAILFTATLLNAQTPIFDWDARTGSLIDQVSGTKGTLTVGNGGFVKTEKGLAMEFDGSATSLAITETTYDVDGSQVSFEIWCKRDNITTEMVMLGGDQNVYKYLFLTTDGRIILESNTNENIIEADLNNDDTNWHHYILITNGDGTGTFYQDNIALSTSGTLTNGVSLSRIGSALSSKYFKGDIAKVRIYDEAISASKRAELYNEFLHSYGRDKEKRFNLNVVNKPTSLTEDSLVAAYNMIPQSGTLVDISGNGNNGTKNGNPLSSLEGVVFHKVNDEYYSANSVSPSLDGLMASSISVRFKPADISSGNRYIVSLPEDAGGSNGFDIRQIGTKIAGIVRANGTSVEIQTASVLTAKEWFDVTLTYDGETTTLYLNGILQDTIAQTGALEVASNQIYIGDFGTFNAPFDGEISDVRIYNKALTSAEAIAYHNSFVKPVLIEDFSDAGADGVVKTPREWIKGTGSYKVDELAIEEGELNYSFTESNGETNISSDGFTLDYVGGSGTKNTGIKISDGTVFVGTLGKRYKVTCTLTINSGSITGTLQLAGGWLSLVNSTLSVGTNSVEWVSNGSNGVYIAINSSTDVNYTVSNFRLTEIPPLDGFNSGTDYLECTTAGTIATQSNTAYGTWEFDMYINDLAGAQTKVVFISDNGEGYPNTNGYHFLARADELDLRLTMLTGYTADDLFITATSYITTNTWYRIKITRTTDGKFTVYIKGGDFGDTYTLVDVTGGSGSNPVTNNTYTTSNYFVGDLDAGDRITNIKILNGVKR